MFAWLVLKGGKMEESAPAGELATVQNRSLRHGQQQACQPLWLFNDWSKLDSCHNQFMHFLSKIYLAVFDLNYLHIPHVSDVLIP